MAITQIGTNGVASAAIGTSEIEDNSVTLAELEHGTEGDILYYAAAGAPTRLAKGTACQLLRINSGATAPEWATVSGARTVTGTTDNGIITWINSSSEFQNEANLTFDGSILTLGQGQLAFPATQNASGGANTLDDYEEGTWTPTLQDSSLSNSESQGYLRQTGSYVKIGKTVICHFELAMSSLGTLTGSQNANLAGLPFAVASTPSTLHYSVNIGAASGLAITGGTSPAGIAAAGNSYIYLYVMDDAGGHTSMTITEVSADGLLRGCVIYEV